MFIVLVQNPETHRFLAEGNEWKKRQVDAKAFNSGDAAIEHCSDHKIDDYQLVIHFDDANQRMTEPYAGQAPDCDQLIKTIKAAVQSRRPILDIPTPPLPRHHVLCTGLRTSVESLKQLPSLLRLVWNSPKCWTDHHERMFKS